MNFKLISLKLIGSLLLVLLLSPNSYSAGPRAYSKSGTATTTNAVITISFSSVNFKPFKMDVCNDGSSIDLYIDFTDGIAVAADDSTNFLIKPNECEEIQFDDRLVAETVQVGVITGSSTTSYRINAWSAR